MKTFRAASAAVYRRSRSATAKYSASTRILSWRGALVRGAVAGGIVVLPVTLAMCDEAAPGGDLDLTDEAVELITDRVGEALELPFIPAAFQHLFLQQMVQIVLRQLGPQMPRRIHAFAERNENALDEAGLEGLVDEIVEQIEPGVTLPLLDAKQKRLCVTCVVRCVVAYSLPGAAVVLLGSEAADCGVSVVQMGVGSTAALLDADKRHALVQDVQTVIPKLPFVNQTVQHSAIEWCVDTLAALLTAAIPSEVASTLVCFSDDELRLLEDKLCQAAVDTPTALDLMMDRTTKEKLVRAAIPRMFSLLYDASDGDVAAARRLRALHKNQLELQRKLRLLEVTAKRKTTRFKGQLEAVEKKQQRIWAEHPQFRERTWTSWAPWGLLAASTAAVGIAAKAGWLRK